MHPQSCGPLLEGKRGGKENGETKTPKNKINFTNKGVRAKPFSIKNKTCHHHLESSVINICIHTHTYIYPMNIYINVCVYKSIFSCHVHKEVMRACSSTLSEFRWLHWAAGWMSQPLTPSRWNYSAFVNDQSFWPTAPLLPTDVSS